MFDEINIARNYHPGTESRIGGKNDRPEIALLDAVPEAVVGPGGDLDAVAEPGVGECPAGQGCAAGKIQVGHSIEESIIHGQIGQIEGKTIFSYLFY